MGEERRAELAGQLAVADESLGFLLAVAASVLLSLWALGVQRRGLALALAGEEAQAAALPGPLPARRAAGALLLGALGYFLSLALEGWEEARSGTEAQRRSAGRCLWAALFVLLAALLRFQDLAQEGEGAGGSFA